jgi:hypothetical protein
MMFDGETYDEALDEDRLKTQLARVRALMWDQRWRTLDDISRATGDPQASVSARLRDRARANTARTLSSVSA